MLSGLQSRVLLRAVWCLDAPACDSVHYYSDAAGVETALGQRDRQSALRAVVSRQEQSLRGRVDEQPLQPLLGVEVQFRGLPANQPMHPVQYSDPPSSARVVPSSTTGVPARLNVRVSTFEASSMTPTMPRTGVGRMEMPSVSL